MALLQSHTLSHPIPSFPPIFSSSKTHLQNSLFFSTTKIRPFSLSTQPRKLLCKPPLGKHVREDYLVLVVEFEKNAIIVKVGTDDEYEFAHDMQVRGLPTLFFISPDPNKEAIHTEGLIPIQMMRDTLDNEM
ncbi:hypothetical protein CRYUN_Cryun05aG0116100 [Craigia yunnanensis]